MNKLRILARLVKPYKHLLVLSFVLSLIFSILSALSVYLTIPLLKTLFEDTQIKESITTYSPTDIIDNVRYQFEAFIFSGTSKFEALARVCILLFSVYLLKNITGYIQSIVTQYAEKLLANKLRIRIYEQYNKLSLRYLAKRRSGDIITRIITDTNNVQAGIAVTFTNLIKEPITIIIFLIMAFFISWKLTLISLLIIPFSVLLILFVGQKLNKYSKKVVEKLSEFTSTISETIYGGRIIRAFSMENFENSKFKKQVNEYFNVIMKHSVYNDLTKPVTEVISIAVGVIIIWFGGQEVLGGSELSSEEFIGFLLIIFSLIGPIKDLGSVNNMIQQTTVSANRVFEIIDAEPDIADTTFPIQIEGFNKSIEFRNVNFNYEPEHPVLININLKIEKGEQIAIVGHSGVGKSTLIDLLPRFYEVTSGNILIDGIPIKDIKLSDLRKLFAIVTQEIILFNDTIKKNIAYGLDNISTEKIIEAAKNANAHDFIIETENGYDTLIGERGTKLSGGQKQRIAIARALLKDSPIFIFDEATSSLDSESEILIQEAIENLKKGKTSIVIAHRLSTIKNSDRIIVLENGKIAEQGSHEELISNDDSLYKKYYEIA